MTPQLGNAIVPCHSKDQCTLQEDKKYRFHINNINVMDKMHAQQFSTKMFQQHQH